MFATNPPQATLPSHMMLAANSVMSQPREECNPHVGAEAAAMHDPQLANLCQPPLLQMESSDALGSWNLPIPPYANTPSAQAAANGYATTTPAAAYYSAPSNATSATMASSAPTYAQMDPAQTLFLPVMGRPNAVAHHHQQPPPQQQQQQQQLREGAYIVSTVNSASNSLTPGQAPVFTPANGAGGYNLVGQPAPNMFGLKGGTVSPPQPPFARAEMESVNSDSTRDARVNGANATYMPTMMPMPTLPQHTPPQQTTPLILLPSPTDSRLNNSCPTPGMTQMVANHPGLSQIHPGGAMFFATSPPNPANPTFQPQPTQMMASQQNFQQPMVMYAPHPNGAGQHMTLVSTMGPAGPTSSAIYAVPAGSFGGAKGHVQLTPQFGQPMYPPQYVLARRPNIVPLRNPTANLNARQNGGKLGAEGIRRGNPILSAIDKHLPVELQGDRELQADRTRKIQCFVVVKGKREGHRYVSSYTPEELPLGSFVLVEGDRGATVGVVVGYVSLEQMADDCIKLKALEDLRNTTREKFANAEAGAAQRQGAEGGENGGVAQNPTMTANNNNNSAAAAAAKRRSVLESDHCKKNPLLVPIFTLMDWPWVVRITAESEVTELLHQQHEEERNALEVAESIVKHFVESNLHRKTIRSAAAIAALEEKAAEVSSSFMSTSAAAKEAEQGGSSNSSFLQAASDAAQPNASIATDDSVPSNTTPERQVSSVEGRIDEDESRRLAEEIKLVDCEYQLNRRKLTLYVSRPSRDVFVDFRRMQRKLYRTFRCRIWMAYVDEVSDDTDAPDHQLELFLNTAKVAEEEGQTELHETTELDS